MRSFQNLLFVLGTAAVCLTIFLVVTLITLYYTGNRTYGTVLSSKYTRPEQCWTRFKNSRINPLLHPPIDVGYFMVKESIPGETYFQFVIGIPTASKPCSFPFQSGVIIPIKTLPYVPFALLLSAPLINIHLPLSLALFGAICFLIAGKLKRMGGEY